MATGKVVIFLGSPRAHAHTTALAREAGRGAKDAGLEVREYNLNDTGVRGCQSCFHCRGTYGCTVKDYLAPMYGDIAEASAVVVASPIYFYQITGQAKLWVDRMFPMIDGNFTPRQPGKKVATIFAQNQKGPDTFKSAMDWLNNILTDSFGWNLTASMVCCGEPDLGSAEFGAYMKQAYAAGAAFGQGT